MDEYTSATYGERIADIYDDWYGNDGGLALTKIGSPDDVANFLVALVGIGASVLELGVGTGRLALPLAKRGLTTTGLDSSPSMLEKLRGKPGAERLILVEGDMADPMAVVQPPGGGFSAVLVGFNTFFNLTSAETQSSCLSGVAELLRPGGFFVLEAFVPDPGTHDPNGNGTLSVRSIELDQVLLEAVSIDRDSQVITGQRIRMNASGNQLFPFVLRYATPTQLDDLATEAGLVLENRRQDWVGTPFTEDSATHVSTWRRVAD